MRSGVTELRFVILLVAHFRRGFGVRGHVRAFESGPAVAGSPHSKVNALQLHRGWSCAPRSRVSSRRDRDALHDRRPAAGHEHV